jgi:aminoglycoside phosphotransferase (APT) family kinase protein
MGDICRHPRLDEAEITRLRTLATRLKALCATVAACGIPGTRAHGDFHCGNVMVSGDPCIIYDWSDACVGHPFFDLHTVFLSNFPDTLPDKRDHLRDTYLDAWTSFAAKKRLIYAFEQFKPLNAMHQAVSYRHVLEGLEPDTRAELRGGLTYWLRMVLELE